MDNLTERQRELATHGEFKDGRLYARASAIAPHVAGLFPVDDDADIELVPARDGWTAYAATRLHSAWRMVQDRYYLPCDCPPTLHVAAKVHGGLDTVSGGYYFHRADGVAATLREFGHLDPTFPDGDRKYVISEQRGLFVVKTEHLDGDETPTGWATLKGHWTRVFENPHNEAPHQFGDIIRSVDVGGAKDGWYFKSNGRWVRRSGFEVACVLQSYNLTKTQAHEMMGRIERQAYNRVCIPFGDEYPAPRTWNIDPPKYRYQPIPGEHPTWDRIFAHVGRDLGDGGALYLMQWFACVLRFPREPLPYLFLFGDENTGKSILHESFELLVTKGVVKADRALTSDFNGELEGAVLAVVEEKDVAKPGVLARIKDCVTALELPIRRMRTDQYQVPNFCHWVQTANTRHACPVMPGDSRIVVIHVGRLEAEIPKPILVDRLKAEAPALMHTLLTMPLPEPTGRLRLPVIETDTKRNLQDENAHPLARAVVELMHDRDEWQGTAAELSNATRVEFRTDMRNVSNILTTNKPYLERHGIRSEFPEKKTNRGKVLILSKDTNQCHTTPLADKSNPATESFTRDTSAGEVSA